MKRNNMKRYTLFIIGLLILFSCTQVQKSPLEELKTIGMKMKQNSHVEYSYQIKAYRSYSGDTTLRQGKMYFEHNPSDSLLGLNFYHKSNASECFYNGDYLINKEGEIVYSQIGHDSLKLEKAVEKLLNNTPNKGS